MLHHTLTLPCGLRVSNRIVKAAMTEKMAGPDGAPTPRLTRLFTRFAQGGAGVLITGNVAVDGHHLESFGNVTLDTAPSEQPFRAWAGAGRAHDVPVVMQINHPGRQAMRLVDAQPIAPSAVALPSRRFFAIPRAMTAIDIRHVIQQFVHAAQLAARTGFAGVEIHAAHGYLLNQFLSPNTNQRSDPWGGSLENRARLLLEIVDRVRLAVPGRFAVGVKLNASDFVKGGLEPSDALRVAGLLKGRGLDFLEVSGGTFERAASFGRGLGSSSGGMEGYFIEFSRKIKDAVQVPVVLTGGLRSAGAMNSAIKDGACDLVGLARPLVLDPDLPKALLYDDNARAREAQLRFPRGPVGPLAELCWYGEQLERIALGREPLQAGSATPALVRRLLVDPYRAWRRKSYLARATAAAPTVSSMEKSK
jgi:2,4-dienoyl-CoA reductase-like NADH-dependent reductase (Old Yellow Enzyme family)